MGRRRTGRSRSSYGWRRERQSEERRFEMLMFGGVVIMLLVGGLATTNNGAPTVSFIGGGILIGGGIIQLQRRWDVNPFTWLGGVALLLVGYGMGNNNLGLAIPRDMLYPILIMVGVLVTSFLRGDI